MSDSYRELEDGQSILQVNINPLTTSIKDAHDKSNKRARRKLVVACLFCFIFMVVEIVAGYFANSLALMSDATHLLSDVFAFLISIFAITLSNLRGNHKMSFGYHRVEILGALCSILLIWALTASLIYVSIQRFYEPPQVDGPIMLITAFIGTIINLFITYILKVHHHGHQHKHVHGHQHGHQHGDQHGNQHGHIKTHPHAKANDHHHSDAHIKNYTEQHPFPSNDNSCQSTSHIKSSSSNNTPIPGKSDSITHNHENINLRAAYLHALGDLIQNIGVLIAGVIIWLKPTWSIVDPICTLAFSLLVLYTTFSILIESLNVLMEGSPVGIDTVDLHSQLSKIEGVLDVHDLHVWSLSVGKPSLACHIVVDETSFPFEILKVATAICQIQFGILHTTIQIDINNKKEECSTFAHVKCN